MPFCKLLLLFSPGMRQVLRFLLLILDKYQHPTFIWHRSRYINIQVFSQEQIYLYPGIYIDIQSLSDRGADISSYGYRYQTFTWHNIKHIQAWIGIGIGFCLVIKHSRINLRWRGDTSVALLLELGLETWVNHVSWLDDLRFGHVLHGRFPELQILIWIDIK